MATSSIGNDIQITDKKERLRLFEESIAMINNSQIPSESFEQANEFECVSEKKKRKIEINLSEWESVILSGKGTVEFK